MGPTWPLLLMYESHGMRHIGFSQVEGGQRDPRDRGVTQITYQVHISIKITKSFTYLSRLQHPRINTSIFLNSLCEIDRGERI